MNSFFNNLDFKIDGNPLWSVLEKYYNDYYLNNNNKNIETIPKIIHQIWLGSKIPAKYNRITNTWKEKNPDWEYKLWTDDDVSKINLVNNKIYNLSNNYGIKSDILRTEILYQFGGLYVDTDFECIKSFNDLTYLDFFTGNGYSKFPHVYNGLMACKPKHQLMLDYINGIKEKENTNLNVGFGDMLKIAGPDYFSDVFFNYIKKKNIDDKIVVFPRLFFYSVPPGIRREIREDNEISRKLTYSYLNNNSYCIHLWHTSWQK
jgi:mannosyltransferase OCH1-like enzyme